MGWLDPSPALRILPDPTPFCLGPRVLSFAEDSEQEHRASGWVLLGSWSRVGCKMGNIRKYSAPPGAGSLSFGEDQGTLGM